MPNIQSAKKELRKNKKRAVINEEITVLYKKALKEINKAIALGEKDLKEKVRLAQKALDKAAKRGVIKANTASRKFSRLTKRVKKAVTK